MVFKQLNVTIDEKTYKSMDDEVKKGQFRNRSHLVELAIKQLIKKTKQR